MASAGRHNAHQPVLIYPAAPPAAPSAVVASRTLAHRLRRSRRRDGANHPAASRVADRSLRRTRIHRQAAAVHPRSPPAHTLPGRAQRRASLQAHPATARGPGCRGADLPTDADCPRAILLIVRHTFPGDMRDQSQQPIRTCSRRRPSRFSFLLREPRCDNCSPHLAGRGAWKIRLRPDCPAANPLKLSQSGIRALNHRRRSFRRPTQHQHSTRPQGQVGFAPEQRRMPRPPALVRARTPNPPGEHSLRRR